VPVPLLRDIFVILILAVVVSLACHRARIPTLVGLLVTGVIAGPHGLGLVTATHEVETLAEIGVILLLFTIGIEFSLATLVRIRRLVFAGGLIQVVLTAALTWAVAVRLGVPAQPAVLVGCVTALSSTAIILKLLQERSELAAPHGRTTLGILIFQDIAVIPMMLAVPMLAGTAPDLPREIAWLVGKGAVIAFVTWALARWVVPRLFEQIARTGSNELFLLTVGLLCFAVAWFTSLMGLSLALGAFLAGLIISESDFSHRALGSAVPFRDVFTAFFFVSIGMLLDVGFVAREAALLGLLTLGVIMLKTMTGTITGLALGQPFRIAVLAGIALAQVGEFSLVLMTTGLAAGLIPDVGYQRFLAVAIFTMAVTPLVLKASHPLADAWCRLPLPARIRAGRHFVADSDAESLRDHIVVVGFGVIGRLVAQSARLLDIPYVVVEINYETVRKEQERGEPIFYGDATQPAVLQEADVAGARVLVVSIPDPLGVRRTVEAARALNRRLYIVARTRYVQEMLPLYRSGADDVVPEELEASVEIFTNVLHRYNVPAEQIAEFGGLARRGRPARERDPSSRGD
jgi:CPA2 family monovalent cation:H+ antiporter-2